VPPAAPVAVVPPPAPMPVVQSPPAYTPSRLTTFAAAAVAPTPFVTHAPLQAQQAPRARPPPVYEPLPPKPAESPPFTPSAIVSPPPKPSEEFPAFPAMPPSPEDDDSALLGVMKNAGYKVPTAAQAAKKWDLPPAPPASYPSAPAVTAVSAVATPLPEIPTEAPSASSSVEWHPDPSKLHMFPAAAEDDDAAMMDVMRHDGYHVKAAPVEWKAQAAKDEWKPPAPAPVMPADTWKAPAPSSDDFSSSAGSSFHSSSSYSSSPTSESMGFRMPPPPPEDDDAAMLDVMRGHGYAVHKPPPGFNVQPPPAPQPAPLPPPLPVPAPSPPPPPPMSLVSHKRSGADDDDDDDESLVDAMKRNGFHSFSEAPAPSPPPPPPPAPRPPPPPAVVTAAPMEADNYGSTSSSSYSPDYSSSSSFGSYHSSPSLPSFARKMPAPPEDDDDAMLDVMRADGYHVSKPGHAFLLQTRARAWDRASWQPDIPREEAAVVQGIATFLAADLGTGGATGLLIKRIAQQSKAENIAMLTTLRDHLQSQAIACGNEPGPVSDVDKAEGAARFAEQKLEQLQSEAETLRALRGESLKARASQEELRKKFVGLLTGKLLTAYSAANADLEAAAACPPTQIGADLFQALSRQAGKDVAALSDLATRWEAPADDLAASKPGQSPEKLGELLKERTEAAKTQQLATSAAQEKLQRLKLASATPRPAALCADETHHLDLLEAVRRALRMLK